MTSVIKLPSLAIHLTLSSCSSMVKHLAGVTEVVGSIPGTLKSLSSPLTLPKLPSITCMTLFF